MNSSGWPIESHSIEYVPEAERYGNPRRLFTIWFSINLSIVCLTVGTLGVSAGLPLGWAILALSLGNGVGTIFMAAHSAQGPQLGVPQMIQSRAQFGVYGAALPLLAVVLTYTLYTAADAVVVRDTLKAILAVSDAGAMILFGCVTLLVAFVGYEAIHRLGAVLAVISLVLMIAATVLIVASGPEAAGAAPSALRHFSAATFMLTTTQAAAWSLSFGPYVADYSRYLPTRVSAQSTFWMTAAGNFLGATAVMSLGAFLAANHAAIARDPGTGLANAFGAAAYPAHILIALGVLQGNVMNLYSAYMSSATIFTGVHGMTRLSARAKLVLMSALIAAATLIAILTQYRFDVYFGDMLGAMIYILVPWSAINLTDYYLVRKGRYSIDDLFRASGRYRGYRWKVLAVYVISILLQIPFMQLSFFTGPVAALLGADLAWVPGLIVPAALYALVERAALPSAPRCIKPGDS
jgi:NCS1 family nucleobase:cation symporter-1